MASNQCSSAVSGVLHRMTMLSATCALVVVVGLTSPGRSAAQAGGAIPQDPSRLLIVDCLLPGQVRKLGGQMTYLSPRRPVKTNASDCEIRGGEYVAYDRANYASSLAVWAPQAETGDPAAQTYVGEIFEKGLGRAPDPAVAAQWYAKAAAQGYTRAQMNLAFLYEQGLGVPRDPAKALNLYREASGIKDDSLTYVSEVTAVRTEMQATVAGLTGQLEQQSETVAQLQAQLESSQREATAQGEQLARARSEARALQQQVADLKAQPADPARARQLQQLEQELLAREAKVAQQERSVASLEADTAAKRTQLASQAPAAPQATVTMRSASAAPLGTGVAARSVPKELRRGTYHALIIGNNRYQNMPNLETAINDAQAVDAVLRSRYGFRTRVLVNATRADILQALNDYRQSLQADDSLLIYYAGHGQLDKANAEAYWLPVNAQRDNTVEWVSGQQITAQINLMAARHVMIVADSCYQGIMTRSTGVGFLRAGGDAAQIRRLTNLAKLPSRTVLTSGGEQPVLDGGGGDHSIFAQVLLRVLDSNTTVLEGGSLYNAVFDDVRQAARRMKQEQSPRYDVLADAGHRNGEFLFIPLT